MSRARRTASGTPLDLLQEWSAQLRDNEAQLQRKVKAQLQRQASRRTRRPALAGLAFSPELASGSQGDASGQQEENDAAAQVGSGLAVCGAPGAAVPLRAAPPSRLGLPGPQLQTRRACPAEPRRQGRQPAANACGSDAVSRCQGKSWPGVQAACVLVGDERFPAGSGQGVLLTAVCSAVQAPAGPRHSTFVFGAASPAAHEVGGSPCQQPELSMAKEKRRSCNESALGCCTWACPGPRKGVASVLPLQEATPPRSPAGSEGPGVGGLLGGLFGGILGGAAADEVHGSGDSAQVLSPTTSPNRQLQQSLPSPARRPSRSPIGAAAEQRGQHTPPASPGLLRRQSGVGASPSRLASPAAGLGQRTPPGSVSHSQRQSPAPSPGRLPSVAGLQGSPDRRPLLLQRQSPAASPLRLPASPGQGPRSPYQQPAVAGPAGGSPGKAAPAGSPQRPLQRSPQRLGVVAAAGPGAAGPSSSPNPLAKLVRQASPARLAPAVAQSPVESGDFRIQAALPRQRSRVTFGEVLEAAGGGAAGPAAEGSEEVRLSSWAAVLALVGSKRAAEAPGSLSCMRNPCSLLSARAPPRLPARPALTPACSRVPCSAGGVLLGGPQPYRLSSHDRRRLCARQRAGFALSICQRTPGGWAGRWRGKRSSGHLAVYA